MKKIEVWELVPEEFKELLTEVVRKVVREELYKTEFREKYPELLTSPNSRSKKCNAMTTGEAKMKLFLNSDPIYRSIPSPIFPYFCLKQPPNNE